MASLEVQLAEVTSRRNRIKGLMDGGSVATQELDKVEAELEALQYERDAAAWALEAKRSETESLNKEYRRMQYQAGADHIDENQLVCPVETAVVAEILVSPGAKAEAGVPAQICGINSPRQTKAKTAFLKVCSPSGEL